MGKLTAKQVENAGAGMHADGEGLYLQVGTGGARSWVYRFTLHRKERYLGLGSAADKSGRNGIGVLRPPGRVMGQSCEGRMAAPPG
jgi:hypothetical protein